MIKNKYLVIGIAILVFSSVARLKSDEQPLPLSIATAEYPHIEPIRNGTIKIPECQISYSTFTISELESRFDRGQVGDVIEVDFLRCLKIFSENPKHDWVLVPVYLRREFPQRHIVVHADFDPHTKQPIRAHLAVDYPSPSMVVWAKGIYDSSPTINASETVVWDQSITTSASVSSLYLDYKSIEQNYFRATRIFPIVTVLAVRAELVKENPWLPEALFIAFSEAKAKALDAGTIPLPWGPESRDETVELMNKNYWSYGVRNNPKTLNALFKYAHEQGITSKLLEAEDVFAPETLQLIDEKGAKN